MCKCRTRCLPDAWPLTNVVADRCRRCLPSFVTTDECRRCLLSFVTILVLQSVVAYAEYDEYSSEDYVKRQLVPLPRYGRMALKRQGATGMLPMPRVGRAEGMLPMPRVGRANGMLPMPRVGRAEGMLPMPRVGRSWSKLVVGRSGLDRSSNKGLVPLPRVGRAAETAFWFAEPVNVAAVDMAKHERDNLLANDSNSRFKRSTLNSYGDLASDEVRERKWLESNNGMSHFQRTSRQLIPAIRVGRRSIDATVFDSNALLGSYLAASTSVEDGAVDNEEAIDAPLRALYVPRLGLMAALKRAAFTPRIGRAVAFTPRLGRSSWDIDTDDMFESRMARAAFTPRIGRSVPSDKAIKQGEP